MLSKLSKNLSRGTSRSLDLRIHHISKERATLARRTEDRVPLHQTTRPSHNQRRETGRQRKTLGNGASSTRAHGTTLTNAARSSHYCPKSKLQSQIPTPTLILNPTSQSTTRESRSLMQNPVSPSLPHRSNQRIQRNLRKASTSSTHRCG